MLLMLLNPFLVILYLTDLLKKHPLKKFTSILVRAGIISTVVFVIFALIGDAVFSKVIHAEFASFQIFGGMVFLIIGLQFAFRGTDAIDILRGDSPDVAGAIAMPIMIGPGTLGISVIIGKRLAPLLALGAVAFAVFISIAVMVL